MYGFDLQSPQTSLVKRLNIIKKMDHFNSILICIQDGFYVMRLLLKYKGSRSNS